MEQISRESRIFYGSEASCSKRNIIRPVPRSRAMAPKRGPKQQPVVEETSQDEEMQERHQGWETSCEGRNAPYNTQDG